MTSDEVLAVPLDEYESLIEEYEAARRRVEAEEAHAAILRAHLIKLLPTEDEAPDGTVGLVDGHKRVSYMPASRKRVDLVRLRKIFPDVATECTDYTVAWTLRTHRRGE